MILEFDSKIIQSKLFLEYFLISYFSLLINVAIPHDTGQVLTL